MFTNLVNGLVGLLAGLSRPTTDTHHGRARLGSSPMRPHASTAEVAGHPMRTS